MESLFDIPHSTAVFAAALAALTIYAVFGALNRRALPSPAFAFFSRMGRLAFFAIIFAPILEDYIFGYPFWTLILCGGAIWWTIETAAIWVGMCIMNDTDFADSRRYVNCDNAWRPESVLIKIKNEIERAGFKKIGSAKSAHEDIDLFRSTIFENADGTRLEVAFVPLGRIMICETSAVTKNADGKIYITQSAQIPFGLVYPQQYTVRRLPWTANPLAVLNAHQRFLKREKITPSKFGTDHIRFLNSIIEQLELENRKIGLLNTDTEFDEGWLSSEGKYQFWISAIKINYFPFLIK